MSTASEKARASFGATLTAGMRSRGQGAPLPAQAAASTPPDVTPQRELEKLENRIQASVEQYQHNVRQLQVRHRQELGLLLEEIHSRPELYKAGGHATFGRYIKDRWGWDRSYVYRLMDLALVRRALSPLGPPVLDSLSESQARPLATVVRDHGDEAAQRILRESLRVAEEHGRKLTAAVITRVRESSGLTHRAEVSPIGDTSEGDVVDAELVEEAGDEAADLVNTEIQAAAAAAEKAVRLLDSALARNITPLDPARAGQDLSRLRTAAVRLGKRANNTPG